MSVLRVFDPPECDAAGVPLDWERCRACGGGGLLPTADPAKLALLAQQGGQFDDCEKCAGHGSLKAAALHALAKTSDDPRAQGILNVLDENGELAVRCEGCGHPMSDGTWEKPGQRVDLLPGIALSYLKRGDEPDAYYGGPFWSPCDERCTHESENVRQIVHKGVTPSGNRYGPIEASWRQVDVRTLGWPHDLRPEKLAVLCLRCWAARS